MEEKDNFYDQLRSSVNAGKKKGMVIIGADMNARILEPGSNPSDGIGPYVFGSDTPTIKEAPGVDDNRQLLQDFLIRTNTTLTNTYFKKRPEHQITYRVDKSARTEHPYTKGRFDVIDYIIVHKRWQNRVKNVYSDITSGINSDHYPLVADIKINLKAEYNKQKEQLLFQPCNMAEQSSFQRATRPHTARNNNTHHDWRLDQRSSSANDDKT